MDQWSHLEKGIFKAAKALIIRGSCIYSEYVQEIFNQIKFDFGTHLINLESFDHFLLQWSYSAIIDLHDNHGRP
jgi:hypothetical protein